ncbi:hypothetical protein MKW94_015174 [Papaver nudicaule]|uniref:NAC domain-containing protein n=1 Tax=Papaver nudicaule TaxID=74823 RepID=A0AA41V6H0_PAPNU|nr:hypothetical protein [Papaver nudicaule]
MASSSLPPGFRFHPTDDELVSYYLKKKVEGQNFELEVIPVIELYKYEPWELPDKSFLPKRDMEWFFFCPRDRKYPNGSRTNRATKAGYWKATGKDRRIVCQAEGITGFRKTLVFYSGRAPAGDRTDWVMHEYRLTDDIPQGSSGSQGAYALCRVVKKNEPAQKYGEFHGESKSKWVGGLPSTGNTSSSAFQNGHFSTSGDNPSHVSSPYNGSNYLTPMASPYDGRMTADFGLTSFDTSVTNEWMSSDLILDTSKAGPSGDASEYLQDYESTNQITSWSPCQTDSKEILPTPSYSNFMAEVEPTYDVTQNNNMSSYLGEMNYMGFYGEDDSTYPTLGTTDSLRSLNYTMNGFEAWNPSGVSTPICRQTSGDGSLLELANSWMQEEIAW